MRLILAGTLVALAATLGACSDSPAGSGSAGKKPSLSKGADDFMKIYGATESGVGDAGEQKPHDVKSAGEQKPQDTKAEEKK